MIFDITYYTEKLGFSEAELDRAAEHYSKGEIKKFKNLNKSGKKWDKIRRYSRINLARNKGKFVKPVFGISPIKIQDDYQQIKTWVDDYKKKNNGRLPNKMEVERGTGFSRKFKIPAGEKEGHYKLSTKPALENLKKGAAKRIHLQTKTPQTTNVPILRTSGPGTPVTEIIWPDKKIGNKTYKQAFIDDLKLRYKYPSVSREAVAAGVLSDTQMARKYGFPAPASIGPVISHTNKFEGIKANFPVKSSAELLKSKKEYRGILKDIQGKQDIPKGLAGTKKSGTHLQHALLKDPKLPITAENLVFIPQKMNTKYVRKLEILRNNITTERALLLKNKPKDWIKKVEFLNAKGIEIPAATNGLIQFESIDHKGNRFVHKLGSEKYQLDILGLNKDKLLKDYTKADWDALRLNVDRTRTRGSKIPVRPFRTNVQTILESFKDLANPQKIKTAIALHCIAAAEGGRIGYALGSGTINCVNTKLTSEPVQSSMRLRAAEGVGKIRGVATNFLKLAGKFGARAAPLAAVAALGVAAEPLVKQFRSDDYSTYLSDPEQQGSMLLSMVEAETPKVDQEILKWQYPGMAASAAAAIPGSSALMKARTAKGFGVPRAALGPVGKFLAGSFSPLGVAATLPISVAAQRKGGSEWEDIATDPFNWMAPAFASAGARMATRGMASTGILAKAIRMGMSPTTLRLGSRFLGMPGLALSAGLTGYDWWKNRGKDKDDEFKIRRYKDDDD